MKNVNSIGHHCHLYRGIVWNQFFMRSAWLPTEVPIFLFVYRKMGPFLVAVNVAGLAIGAASTIGVAENAFTTGLAAGWYNAAWSAGELSRWGFLQQPNIAT